MNSGISASAAQDGFRLAIGDLFASPRQSAVPCRERVVAQVSVLARFAHDGGRRRENADEWPDSPFAAAWLLLQWRWLGGPVPAFHEARRVEGEARTGEACWPAPADPAPTAMRAGLWIAAVDRLRRRPAFGTAVPGASSSPSLWLQHALGVEEAPAPIRLRLDAAGPTLLLMADADPGLLDAAALQSVLEAVAEAAADLLARPDAPLDEIATLARTQRDDQLAAWNAALALPDRSQTVVSRFERQADATPDAAALAYGDAGMTYAELAQCASAMARELQSLGVRAGDRVALVLDRSMEAVAAQLAILQAGAAYVPVPTDWPAARVGSALGQIGVRHVVTTTPHLPNVPPGSVVLRLRPWLPGPSAGRCTAARIDGGSAACVMFTSGTTGSPKAIEIGHGAILRLVLGAAFADFGPGRSMLHAAPLGFDAATLEIWGPLLNGGCCVIHDERVPSGPGLARTIGRHQVQTAWLTAALFNAVIDDDPAALSGLRHLIIGGEALSVPHVRKARACLPAMALSNGYGPTECTTFATTYRIPASLPQEMVSVPLGFPIQQTVLRVLSPSMALLPTGLIGELCIGGHGLALGYVGQPALTAQHFVPDPFGRDGECLYRTGDLVHWLPDGSLAFIGRRDGQIKLHGHRVETGEIEAALLLQPGIRACAVQAWPDAAGGLRLVAYVVARADRPAWDVLRADLAERLPAAWLPAAAVWLDALPLSPNGKLDRQALPVPSRARPPLSQAFEEPRGALEQRVCAAFAQVLQLDQVGRHDNFFDLGGDSLRVLQALAVLRRDDAPPLSPVLFFHQPTPAAIAAQLAGADAAASACAPVAVDAVGGQPPGPSDDEAPIALVAMAGRFPGAADVEQFWDNLLAGRDSIRVFDDDTLDAGVADALRRDPAYVRARGVIDGIEDFDPPFFGFGPQEAALMDPQHRVFLEICWECMERAGHRPDGAQGPVGVFAGMYNATYAQHHLSTRPDLVEMAGEFRTMLGNEKDYIATRVAHVLNLTGPAISVHTACSTSLVAVAQAFQALRTGQCRMALAGGAAVTCPPNSGYLYSEGAMLSPDGHTRSFDARAQGTVFSDGAAVVLLKRLADAQADGDTIYAVLRGVAVNNDGGAKASFTAPSVDGQAAVVRAALAAAQVDARSLSFVEAHGTATPMGDPVEVEALRRAFADHTADTQFCTLGALKSNVGHMVTAAGAAGLIKTALALHHGQIPPTAHFGTPNPAIDFGRTPFRVTSAVQPWPRGAQPRRAGVSAFGVGGTNAHVIVEEAPACAPAAPWAGLHMLALSARSPAALQRAAERLAAHLDTHPQDALADVAHTLAVGRTAFGFRTAVIAADGAAAAAALRDPASPLRVAGRVGSRLPDVVLVFPGQGAQYAGMGRALHAADPVFAAALDSALAAFEGQVDGDLRGALSSADPQALAPTAMTQPALFALEYALAQRVLATGVRPLALIGHSVGEFVAAVLAGVMDLADAARLVAHRGALMQAQPAGAMLAVRLGASALVPLLGDALSLAADNGPCACVAAGSAEAIAALQVRLEAEGVACRRLPGAHAFHSDRMEAAVAPMQALVEAVPLQPPRIPIFSTATGRLLDAAQATRAEHWARHLRDTVRFSAALRGAMAQFASPLFVEAGPGHTLSTLVRQHGAKALPLLDGPADDEDRSLRQALARLWVEGAVPDLAGLAGRAGARRIRLPTYPFERQRCWVDVAPPGPHAAAVAAPPAAAIPAPPRPRPPEPVEPSVTVAACLPDPVIAPSPLDLRLRTLIADLTGTDLADADGRAPFTELGLDSLALTQLATQMRKRFGVPVSFRQLLEDFRCIDALVAHLQGQMPAPVAEPAPAPQDAGGTATAASATPATRQELPHADTPAPAGALAHMIAQQLALMQTQLALLSGPAAAAASAAEPVPAPQPAANMDRAAADPEAAPPRAVPYDVSKAFGAIARIHTQRSAEPSQRQQARLAAFIRRYVERTARSKAFTEAHRPQMADPRVVSGFRPLTKEIVYPLVVERSKGARLWDIDGNDYVDALNGFGTSLFGWQPDFVQEAVRRQLDLGYEIGPQHPLAGDVAALVCELTGCERAGLCNTGSEAVMAALRIARTVTGRSTVVVFSGAYHGTFDEVLVRAGRQGQGLPAAPGVMGGMFGDIRVLDYGTPEALAFIRAHAQDLAAVLVEPVQSRRPELQPREFIHALRAVTESAGCCLVFDEVITGFRTGLGGAQAFYGVRADLATYGKVIGGGFPIGVIAGRRTFMDALDGGAWQYGDDSFPAVGVTYFAGTFVRHPLALAAAKASLQHLKDSGPALQEGLNARTTAMAEAMNAWCAQVGAPLAVRHFASLWRVVWLEEHPLQDLLFPMMRSRGVHILENFPCFLTSAHSAEDILRIQTAFCDAVAELQESGFLPRRAPTADPDEGRRASAEPDMAGAAASHSVPSIDREAA